MLNLYYYFDNAKAVYALQIFFYTPSDEDVADGTLLGDDPVLVCEKWIQLLVQAVVLMGQSVMCKKERPCRKSL